MLKKLLLVTTIALSSMTLTQPVYAQAAYVDPDANCVPVLSENAQGAALWAFGYISHLEGENRTINEGSVADLVAEMNVACNAASGKTFADLVESHFNPPAMAPTSPEPQALLDLFGSANSDIREILLALQPTDEDIRALFAEPLATEMVEMYEELFGRRLSGENFPSPFLIGDSMFSTTKSLADEGRLDDLPGGFKDVVDLYLEDVPFGTIRIIFPSVSDDMKLEGFVYVNGHWVLMMSPWRAL